MTHKIQTLSIIALAIALALPAFAEDYESGFGFGISVPEVWLVLTQDEVLANASVFIGEGAENETSSETGLASGAEESRSRKGGRDPLAAVPPEMRRAVFERVRAGELEIFYRREGVESGFVDNVNVMLQPSGLPKSMNELEGICQILPAEFSRVFGRPIGMDECEMRERAMRRALYLQFDGAIPGTTTLQYQIQRGVGETVVFTATSATPNLARMLNEFEAMVASIRIH